MSKFWCRPISSSLGNTPGHRTAVLPRSPYGGLVRHCQGRSPAARFLLQPHGQCVGSQFLHTHQHLQLSVCCITSHPSWWKEIPDCGFNLHFTLPLIYNIHDAVEHLFTCLLAFVCLLCRNIYSFLIRLSFIIELSGFYIFWTLKLHQLQVCKESLPFCGLFLLKKIIKTFYWTCLL